MKTIRRAPDSTSASSKQKNIRYLTCSSKYNGRNCRVPQLRLVGKWLQEAGFEIGNIVSVETKDNSLIITRLPLKWKIEHIVQKYAVDDAGNKYALR